MHGLVHMIQKVSTPELVYNEPQEYADEKTDDHLETVQPAE